MKHLDDAVWFAGRALDCYYAYEKPPVTRTWTYYRACAVKCAQRFLSS